MKNDQTALPKRIKSQKIVLIVIFSFLLLVSIGGILNQLEDGIIAYLPNLILLPISVFVIIRSSLILSKKVKPVAIPWDSIQNISTIVLLSFCFVFTIYLFFHSISEGSYGVTTFAAFFAVMYGVSIYFWITKFIFKKETPKEKRMKLMQNYQKEHTASPDARYKPEYLDDVTFIQDIKRTSHGVWKQYDVLLAARGYGWDMMKDWADYMAQADLKDIERVKAGDMGRGEQDYTKSYLKNGGKCVQTPELDREMGMLSINGISTTLRVPIIIIWFNQTRVLRLITLIDDDMLMSCYAETMVRRTFGKDDAMKLGRPLPEETAEKKEPVTLDDGKINIDSAAFFAWKKANPAVPQYEMRGAILLHEKEPIITLFEDGVKTREYCLQTEGEEDFTEKYFHISVRLGFLGNPAIPVAQIDGFIADTNEDRKMTGNDIGYRIEGHFLACAETEGVVRYNMIRGRDLPAKGLKYPGYTTPSNVRLIGVCPSCGKSFCFHGYAFYMMQNDVAYSDDGMDCCVIQEYDIDKENWVYETDGKTFRYYNSFNCPHCATPYIDYRTYPEDKVFGVSGCVHLGRKAYRQGK